jgi:hypothetical protein
MNTALSLNDTRVSPDENWLVYMFTAPGESTSSVFSLDLRRNVQMNLAAGRNGERFLIRRPVDRGNRDPWTVIVNWPQLLKERQPAAP